MSWVEMKPASKGRNDPARGARISTCEKRGIFLSNEPDVNELMRAYLKEKCRYADFGGWVISTIAGWFVVTADTRKGLLSLKVYDLPAIDSGLLLDR